MGRVDIWQKIIKMNSDYKCEVLTFAKSSGHFTKYFEGQVHQVLYLCGRESWAISGTCLVMERVLLPQWSWNPIC